MIILFNPQSSAGRKPILPFSLLAVGAVFQWGVPRAAVCPSVVTPPWLLAIRG